MSEFVDAVREENKTELSRLGSSKALYALTEGEMEDHVVLARAADVFHYAADEFQEWNDPVAADAAEIATEAAETAAGELDDYEPGTEPAVSVALRDLAGADARLGGLVGWTLAVRNLVGQLTGYFTGQADPGTASTFREVGSDLDDLQATALDALEDGTDAAETAANGVVEAAYDEYFDTLEELGVNPKPVC